MARMRTREIALSSGSSKLGCLAVLSQTFTELSSRVNQDEKAKQDFFNFFFINKVLYWLINQ